MSPDLPAQPPLCNCCEIAAVTRVMPNSPRSKLQASQYLFRTQGLCASPVPHGEARHQDQEELLKYNEMLCRLPFGHIGECGILGPKTLFIHGWDLQMVATEDLELELGKRRFTL